MTGKNKTGFGGWIFLVIVLLLYATAALFDQELAARSWEHFHLMLGRILPALLLVFVLLLLMNLLLAPKQVKKYLGRHSGLKGWLTALVAGVLSTGPIYAWFAVLRDLRLMGMRDALVAVMIYARAVKLPLLPLLVHYFGLTYTIVLVAYLLGFAILSGIIMERIGFAHGE